ncbi:Pre-mRNA-splicing helicase BRR2, partial [Cryomyces antarcticus]
KLVKRLGLDNNQLADAARFVNENYPNITLEFDVEDKESITAGAPSYLSITLDRELEEDEEPHTQVHAPFFPVEKTENWWLVVVEDSTRSLLAIKRVTVGRQLKTRLEYVVPTPGKHELKLCLMCDSYLGVDQVPEFEVTAAEGMDVDDDEEEEGDDE